MTNNKDKQEKIKIPKGFWSDLRYKVNLVPEENSGECYCINCIRERNYIFELLTKTHDKQ